MISDNSVFNYLVIDYAATGEGRSFWYIRVPASWSLERKLKCLQHTFFSDESAWEFYKIDVVEYTNYEDVCRVYAFMPLSLDSPANMFIRWEPL